MIGTADMISVFTNTCYARSMFNISDTKLDNSPVINVEMDYISNCAYLSAKQNSKFTHSWACCIVASSVF